MEGHSTLGPLQKVEFMTRKLHLIHPLHINNLLIQLYQRHPGTDSSSNRQLLCLRGEEISFSSTILLRNISSLKWNLGELNVGNLEGIFTTVTSGAGRIFHVRDNLRGKLGAEIIFLNQCHSEEETLLHALRNITTLG